MMQDEAEAQDVRVDSTLSKGLRILEALSEARGGKSVTELSRELELTKSNVFRLLQTLCRLGYARQSDDRLYAATFKAWRVGKRVVDNLDLKAVATEQMRHLSRITGHTVYLATPEGLSVVYIDKIETLQPIRSWNPVGGVAPIHAVSTGKAILAADYGYWRDRLRNSLTRYTDKTITTLTALDAEIERIRAAGFAEDLGEFREQVVGYGAAILMPDGAVIGAIGITFPILPATDGVLPDYGALVRDAARQISLQLAQG